MKFFSVICILLSTIFSCNSVPLISNDDDKCWVFQHLQKAGGSTVKSILRNSWGDEFSIYDSGQWKIGDDFLQLIGDRFVNGKKWKVVVGGYTEALRRSRFVEEKCKFFTVFRHPISRIVSAYYYCKNHPQDPLCASNILKSDETDLVTFAKHWGNFGVRQFILSFLSADDVMNSSPVKNSPGWYLLKKYMNGEYSQIPEIDLYNILQPVQDLIREKYVVGILEEFNTTLSLFDEVLDMPTIDWHKEYNKMGSANENHKFDEEKNKVLEEAYTNSELKKYIQLDIILYEHAVDVFHQQVKESGI